MTSKTEIMAAMKGQERAVTTAGSRRRYPWADMEVGDWFVVPGGADVQMRLAACASQASRNHPGTRYATTATKGRVYCVRMPPAEPARLVFATGAADALKPGADARRYAHA